MKMIWRWIVSRAVRQAVELRKQVWIVLHSQRDELSDKARMEVEQALVSFRQQLAEARGAKAVRAVAHALEDTATRWLKPYPNASARENLKEFLVSGVLILSVFSFFIQPMKIPSGSAQPTLYGNLVTALPEGAPGAEVPGFLGKLRDWFRGIDYHLWTAKSGGTLRVGPVSTLAGFIKVQRFEVGNDSYRFFWPPDNLVRDCGVQPGQDFRPGQTILRLRISSGDRLFIDRFTYNFRRPRRGETIVFTSTGIPGLIQHTHYIKRLIALGGEKVRVGDDRHVVINGRRLDRNDPGFEKVYGFQGPAKESAYSGHVNDKVSREVLGRSIAPLFADGDMERQVRPKHYLAFGDNTLNSFDGRAWGDFPQEKVVGKAFFVFWPFTHRFGPAWP